MESRQGLVPKPQFTDASTKTSSPINDLQTLAPILTSNKVMSAGPVMFHTTPVAFSMPMSRRGEEMAPWAAWEVQQSIGNVCHSPSLQLRATSVNMVSACCQGADIISWGTVFFGIRSQSRSVKDGQLAYTVFHVFLIEEMFKLRASDVNADASRVDGCLSNV